MLKTLLQVTKGIALTRPFARSYTQVLVPLTILNAIFRYETTFKGDQSLIHSLHALNGFEKVLTGLTKGIVCELCPSRMFRDSPMGVFPLHMFVLVFRFALVLSKYLPKFAASLVNLATDLVADSTPLFQLLEDLTKFTLRLSLCKVQFQTGTL
jgi:hypothetical protein